MRTNISVSQQKVNSSNRSGKAHITIHITTRVLHYPMQDYRDFWQFRKVIIRFEAFGVLQPTTTKQWKWPYTELTTLTCLGSYTEKLITTIRSICQRMSQTSIGSEWKNQTAGENSDGGLIGKTRSTCGCWWWRAHLPMSVQGNCCPASSAMVTSSKLSESSRK
jgi:hypothetical protein